MLALCWTAACWAAGAIQDAVPETSVKAAFIYKFLSYVEWPAGTPAKDAPMIIGVLGAEQIATELRHIAAGRTVDDHSVQIKLLTRNASLDGVHLLFIGADTPRTQSSLAPEAATRGIVTVTENDAGMPDGSIINLVMAEGRVRFDVSLPAAELARVKLSSRLLAVARAVRAEAP